MVSKPSQLTGPQGPDERLHPACPPLEDVEEIPQRVPVPQARVGGPQSILVTGCQAGQVRKNLQNINAAKITMMAADKLIGPLLGGGHGCSAADRALAPGEAGGLRERWKDWKKRDHTRQQGWEWHDTKSNS